MTIETPGPLFAPFRLTVTGLVSREQLKLDIEQPVVLGWDTLSDRSMSCCVGSRAASDRKPNGWLQAVLALKEKYASCGDLPQLDWWVKEWGQWLGRVRVRTDVRSGSEPPITGQFHGHGTSVFTVNGIGDVTVSFNRVTADCFP
jgi:hypothetical protein